MMDFEEYIRQGEPQKREKVYAWQTAIGLQAVDGLKPSDYLIETARKDIEGEITIDEAEQLIRSYYQSKIAHTPEDGQIYLDWFRSRFEEKSGIRWGIQIKGEAGIIGTIGFNNFTPYHKANIRYNLQSAYWGKGYMSEVLAEIINFGFNNLCVNRIEAEVMTGNTSSAKLPGKS